ncbi:hypothetical protein BUALT_Bualt06G0146100 [Buddleja alternifolia]|uniref:Bet v I/Major latex protein domain-containing protein n=1 Tax=Buddleja alternifolia TaxID=168488 RepID=A0AAV6XF88_9LAMI|nr:hypothetical protein BUALT_Bualt06G0146100 [Buddleja alternifolia]
MYGMVSHEIEVNVAASEAWKLYGTLQLAKIVGEGGLPDLITKVDVVQGDGGVGTILHLFFTSGMMISSYKEKYTVVDDEKRVKEAEVVEGGYLDLGFTLYRVRFEIIEKEDEENKCITKSTIEYEVKEEAAAAANASSLVSIQPMVAIMNLAAHYLIQNHNNNNNNRGF